MLSSKSVEPLNRVSDRWLDQWATRTNRVTVSASSDDERYLWHVGGSRLEGGSLEVSNATVEGRARKERRHFRPVLGSEPHPFLLWAEYIQDDGVVIQQSKGGTPRDIALAVLERNECMPIESDCSKLRRFRRLTAGQVEARRQKGRKNP